MRGVECIILLILVIVVALNVRSIEKLEEFQKNATLELARLKYPLSVKESKFIDSINKAEINRGPGELKK